MSNKHWLTALFLMIVINAYGQYGETRVANSFIIMVDDKLTTSVSRVRFLLTDTASAKQEINGGYYPGVLYVMSSNAKDVLLADSLKKLTLAFDAYKYQRGKQDIRNYSIPISQKWLKQSVIVLRITNRRGRKYDYSFEVPGYSFGKKIK